jgi:hypothetical protein
MEVHIMARKKVDTTDQNENKSPAKTRRKKSAAQEIIAEPAEPKRRGRKPKAETAAPAETATKKRRGRKPKTEPASEMIAEVVAPVEAETAFVDSAPVDIQPEMIVEIAEPAAPAEPKKRRGRKPRSEKTEAPAEPKKRGRKPKEPELVLTTILQLGDTEFDITDIALKAFKAYKSVHKRKVITDFHIYVKPEEKVAYYTINGEGSEEFKVDLE